MNNVNKCLVKVNFLKLYNFYSFFLSKTVLFCQVAAPKPPTLLPM